MRVTYIFIFWTILSFLTTRFCYAQPPEKNVAPSIQDIDFKASSRPDRIILSLTKDPATEIMITWRTKSGTAGIAEITKVKKEVDFYKNPMKKSSITTDVDALEEKVTYHKVKFDKLVPNTIYAYRVGNGDYWSEWNQFKTSEEKFTEAFQFIYMGDAQNSLFPLWSRAVRAAFKKAPNARFTLHVGDLINHSQNNYEWGEWFKASGFIPKMVPTLATLGNHEYEKDSTGHKIGISTFWDPQFNFPENGPENFEDRTYYMDYLNSRIICLDSNTDIETQSKWLEEVLQGHNKQWVILFFHHPVISAARGRANDKILQYWKPLFDKYKVDLVLQGHDHVYGRGNKVNSGLGKWDEDSGTTYVVSVSGRKMYDLSDHKWMDRKGRDIQLYQIITVDQQTLNFKAYTLDDELFDHFELVKREKNGNLLKELTLDE